MNFFIFNHTVDSSWFIVIHHVPSSQWSILLPLSSPWRGTKFPITWSCKHLIWVCTEKRKLQGSKAWTSCLNTMPNDHLNPSNAAASAWCQKCQTFQCFPNSLCMSRWYVMQSFSGRGSEASRMTSTHASTSVLSIHVILKVERKVAIWGQWRCEAESKVVTNGANISVGTP